MPEMAWIGWLAGLDNPLAALRAFSRQYHYFSMNQVVAFSRIFATIPATDRTSLALLSKVLFEELGEGRPDRVHSVLFERFARAVGTDIARLPISEGDVVPGVRDYVGELRAAFGGPLPRALAAYLFLESSAVETYGPLLQALGTFGIADEDLEFFAIHAGLEPEHAAAAASMVERAGLSGAARDAFDDQTARMGERWARFWIDIHAACLDEHARAHGDVPR